MAVKKFFLTFGASNGGPSADYASWIALHPELNLQNSATLTSGSYSDRITVPGSFPGFTPTVDIKGLAISSLRYLTFYHPGATGYRTYPCTGRLTSGAQTSSVLRVEQKFQAAPGTMTIIRSKDGSSHSVTATTVIAGTTEGAILTLSGATWTNPVAGEQFTYTLKVTAGTGTVNLTLNMGFGLLWDGKLTGLYLKGAAGTVGNVGVSRKIISWDNTTRVAVVESVFPSAIAAADTFTVEPAVGTTFATSALFLPWCPFEANITVGRPNPEPPGFNYANHFHLWGDYAAAAAPGDPGSFPVNIAYHVGMGIRLHEYYGEEIYVIASDVSASGLAHNETNLSSGGYGWWDVAQMNSWSPGDNNGCFARLLDELDTAVMAAALEGNTLECVGIESPFGEIDATTTVFANVFASNLRAIKRKLRDAIKSRGMFAGSADSIPWIMPLIPTEANTPGTVWAYADTVNDAIERVTEEDRYMRNFNTDTIPRSVGDPAHFTGVGAKMMEDFSFAAWKDIIASTDQSGEVAICNLALANIGDAAKVTSIDPVDGSAQSTHCARYYAIARDSVLESGQWSFAMRRKALTAVDSDTSSWQYAYLMPADCLRPVAVIPPGASGDYTAPVRQVFPFLDGSEPLVSGMRIPQEFQTEQAEDGTHVIVTNQDEAVLRYVAKVTDTRRFPIQFVEAVAWKLTAMLAGPIIKGPEGAEIAARATEMARMITGKAAASDGVQRQVKPAAPYPWAR